MSINHVPIFRIALCPRSDGVDENVDSYIVTIERAKEGATVEEWREFEDPRKAIAYLYKVLDEEMAS